LDKEEVIMSHHLQKEIERLKELMLKLCADVEKMVSLSTRSVIERDAEMANRVIAEDIKIDNMEVDVEEDCLKILALHQPVAIDLRIIIAVLKINNDLERIGDLAVNIAERSAFLATQKPYPDEFDFASMAEIVSHMLKKSVDALVKMDVELASEVCTQDDKVDRKNRDMYKLVEAKIKEGYKDVTGLIHLLSVSRHLERIADHATNIAEDVIYMIRGDIVRHSTEDYTKQKQPQ
jgi:phosphate transport system protein